MDSDEPALSDVGVFHFGLTNRRDVIARWAPAPAAIKAEHPTDPKRIALAMLKFEARGWVDEKGG
jgi:hypothetical protein